MTKHKYVVHVPKPQPGAYNPDRPISDLVRNQIFHLSIAERHLHPRHQTGTDVHSIKTEREAAEFIHHLTKKLHPAGGKKAKLSKKAKSSPKKSGRKSHKQKGKR